MRSTIAEIDLSAIRDNLRSIRSYNSGIPIVAIVKANAYGHGIIEISRVLRSQNVRFLGVAFAEEAAALRDSGDNGDIMLIVPPTAFDAELVVRHRLHIAAADCSALEAISARAADENIKIPAHIFIDTGMHRDGIHPDEASDFCAFAKSLPGIYIAGVMTHFATADSPDRAFALGQLAVFNRTVAALRAGGYEFEFVHACNSAGMINFPEAWFNLIRPGISLYGMLPDPALHGKIELRPALRLVSRVIKTKSVQPGETVGYSMKFVAESPTRIAVVPIGYGDGYFRALTNKAQCIIKGCSYNLIGSVCMDQLMVDIGDGDVEVGDEVVLIGTGGGESVTANDLAGLVDTIPYEITTSILQRTPRRYINAE
ncbi:MAG: alanine racemase [Candidatus Kapaibacterium sp.]